MTTLVTALITAIIGPDADANIPSGSFKLSVTCVGISTGDTFGLVNFYVTGGSTKGQIKEQIRAAAKAYAETHLSYTFGTGDKVQVLNLEG